MAEFRQVWRLLIDMQVDLVPVYIPSGDNPADFPSRHSQSAEWSFHAGIRAQLSCLSPHAFTLDPFATPATDMSPTYCSFRAGDQCIDNDGMCVSWRNQHIFLNPPWHLGWPKTASVKRGPIGPPGHLQGHCVLLFCDNTTVVQLLRKGTSRVTLLMAELRQVWRLLIDMQVDLVPVYIPYNAGRAGLGWGGGGGVAWEEHVRCMQWLCCGFVL